MTNSDDTDDACTSNEYEDWYVDGDGDGLGIGEATNLCTDTTEVAGSVTNNADSNDSIYCLSDEIDDCDICDGGNSDQDCNGDCFGDAAEDSCGVCSGGNSGHIADSDQDCNGDCFGTAFIDSCNVCSAGETGHTADSDNVGCGCFVDAALSYYVDADGDGLGAGDSSDYCLVDVPEGWVLDGSDSDDACASNAVSYTHLTLPTICSV